jgi:hypothetical protein
LAPSTTRSLALALDGRTDIPRVPPRAMFSSSPTAASIISMLLLP